MKRKLVAIVQARMGSSRLPGKVLMPILGKPVLWHIAQRLKQVEAIDQVIIATSLLKRDDPIADFCRHQDIACFRGHETDVLDRFYQAAKASGAEDLIRITGDCPLADPQLIHQLIHYYYDGGFEYCGVATGAGVANEGLRGRFPDGLDAEIFRFSALERTWKEADGVLYREHVTPYLWKHPDQFRNGVLRSKDKDYSQMRWTMDNAEDYDLIRNIYESLYPENPGFIMKDVLELMEKEPALFSRNQHFVGKEGYEAFWH
jgi:spore coat polysaccharide biosynthesis protein SpsF